MPNKIEVETALQDLFDYPNLPDVQKLNHLLIPALLARLIDKTGQIDVGNIQLEAPEGAASEDKQNDQIAQIVNLLNRIPSTLMDDRLKVDVGEITLTPAAGGATEANQDEQIIIENAINNKLPALSEGKVPVDVDFPETQTVSAISLPLPTGASTFAKQDEQITALNAIGKQTTLASILAEIQAILEVEVTNFPTAFQVSNFPNSFNIGNFPNNFAINNFPVSFAISNLPATQVSRQKLGTASAPTSVTVTTTASKIFNANPNRLSAVFTNTSGVTIYIGSTNGVTVTNGVPISNGEKFEDSISSGEWYAIASSGGPYNLPILEISG